jgi:hypothetical protein
MAFVQSQCLFLFWAQIRAYERDKGLEKVMVAKFLWAVDEHLQAPLHHSIGRSPHESWEKTNKQNLNIVSLVFARSTLFFIKRLMEIRTCKKEEGLENMLISPNSCVLLMCDHRIARNHLHHGFVRVPFSLPRTTSELQFAACTYNVLCYLVQYKASH